MKNSWRSLILIFPALLLMLGQWVKIGFCPCDESFFILNCECVGASTEQTTCEGECCSADNHIEHSSEHPLSSENTPDDPFHHCGNVTIEPAPYPYAYASSEGSINLPDYSPDYYLIPTFDLPIAFGVWCTHLRPTATAPPPDSSLLYQGFFSPLII